MSIQDSTGKSDQRVYGASTRRLQDNRRDFDSPEHDPGDRSPMLSGDPEADGGAEAKDCAGPSAGQRGRLAQYFEYSSHSVTPAQRDTNCDSESIQIGTLAQWENAKNVDKNERITYR